MGFVSMLPNTVELESKYHFNHSQEQVVSYLSTSENWKNWLFYVPKNELEYIQNGPEKGDGSGFKWFNTQEGDGVLEIKKVLENSIAYELVTDDGNFRERGVFLIDGNDTNTVVIWQDTLDVSTNLFARWAADNEGFSDRINKKNLSTLHKIDSLMNHSN